tara:strand:+ start:2867 stop:3394 length:528 start_codon:yes stop_codon:yes gene_type:complete
MAVSKKLDKVITELEEQSNNLQDFNKVYSEIGKLKSDISDNLKLLKEHNDGFESLSISFEKRLEKSKKQLEKLESELLKKIQELYQDNKKFQKELDSSINSRLEKNRSDIQVEIRNEGTQIQRAHENSLTSNFNKMESKFKEKLEEQTKQLNLLKILLFLVLSILIGSAIWLCLK